MKSTVHGFQIIYYIKIYDKCSLSLILNKCNNLIFLNNKLCGRPPQYVHTPCDLDILTLKVVTRVTCDVGYLCANFSLPRPLCSRLTPDVRDRQMSDVRQTSDGIIA